MVEFKSISLYYKKELSGIKNNTLRVFNFDDVDKRKKKLKQFENGELSELQIKIIEPFTGCYFIRDIRDVTIFEDIFFIITWDHID